MAIRPGRVILAGLALGLYDIMLFDITLAHTQNV